MTPSDERAEIQIRDVTDADMPAIQVIYAHHVLHGLASFEEEQPDVAEMTSRRDKILADGYPYRVAEYSGLIAGYAYASRYRPRPAYRYTVENSIYVAKDATGLGIGDLLLDDLIKSCTALGFRQMVAVIGDTENHASINLHEKHGFKRAGEIRSVGFKFGRWVNSVIMQLPLGEGDDTSPSN